MSFLAKAKSIFAEFDTNGSGAVGISELGDCLKKTFGKQMSESELL